MKRAALPLVTDCNNCGACCTEQAALPVSWYTSTTFRGQANKLPTELRLSLERLRDHFLATEFPPDGSPCVWYDAEARCCRHYDQRPDICRTEVEPGDEACRRWRRIKGIDPQPRWFVRNGRLVKEVQG